MTCTTPLPTSRAATAARVLTLLVALCHLTWVLEAVSPSTLPVRSAYVSELMALDQPWSAGFRLIEAAAGVLTLAAVVLWWRVGHRGVPALLTLAGFGVFGLATLADAATPMSCAPSVSRACADAEAAGALPVRHDLHTVSSAVAVTAVAVGVIGLALALRRCRASGRSAAVAVAVAFLACTAWGLVEIAGATPGSPLEGAVGSGGVGWNQRLQISLISVALLVAAAAVPPSAVSVAADDRDAR